MFWASRAAYAGVPGWGAGWGPAAYDEEGPRQTRAVLARASVERIR
jgi:hypothetical protein